MRKRHVHISPIRVLSQRGAAALIGIVLLVVLLFGALVVAYFALTQKDDVSLVLDEPKVSADDLLTSGNSNGELSTDYQIITAGLDRDETWRVASRKLLDDKALPVGDGVAIGTTVETTRLSQLQTEFITEADRRIDILNTALDMVNQLTGEQKSIATKYVGDEITLLRGLKAKAAAETDQNAFLADRDALDEEYTNFGMAVFQAQGFVWANEQTTLVQKTNVLGGKFQERLNTASNSGTSIAKAQTSLNSYQTNKTLATDANEAALTALLALKPSTFNANRAVLEQYYNQLAAAQSSLKKASATSKELIAMIRVY